MRNIINHFAFQFHLDPDDLEQEIQEKLLRTKCMYTPGTATYNTWLNYVVRNHCIDVTRKKANRQSFCTFETWHAGSKSPDYHTREYIASLFWKLRSRWPRKKRVNTQLLWMTMTGWKYEEMARELEMNISTLKVRIHKIRLFLEDFR